MFHLGVTEDEIFHFFRRDIFPAAPDDILDPADEKDHPFLIEESQVAGVQPPLRIYGFGRFFGLLVVSLHKVPSADADFSLLVSGEDGSGRRVDDLHLHPGQGFPHTVQSVFHGSRRQSEIEQQGEASEIP